MNQWFKPILVGGLLCGPLLASCFFAPTGSNKMVGMYPTPDAAGKITLAYTPKGTSVAIVHFVLEGDNATTVLIPDSDTTPNFTAIIDSSKLTPGVYVVDATEDANTTPDAKLTLLVPGDATSTAAATPGGSGAATPTGGASSTTAPASTATGASTAKGN